MSGNFLNGAKRYAGTTQVGEAGSAHGVSGSAIELESVESFGEYFMSASAADMAVERFTGRKEPGALLQVLGIVL